MEEKTFEEIVEKLGNKSYPYIEIRVIFIHKGKENDELYGICAYDNKTKEMTPLDQNDYSIKDHFSKWEEWQNQDDETCLTLWKYI